MCQDSSLFYPIARIPDKLLLLLKETLFSPSALTDNVIFLVSSLWLLRRVGCMGGREFIWALLPAWKKILYWSVDMAVRQNIDWQMQRPKERFRKAEPHSSYSIEPLRPCFPFPVTTSFHCWASWQVSTYFPINLASESLFSTHLHG